MRKKALSPKKERLLAHLLAGESARDAFTLSSIPERSGYRWMSEPGFKSELAARRAVIVDSASGALLAMTERAVMALDEVMSSPEQRGANVKRLAAVNVLELVLAFRDVNIEQRLSNLEEKIQISVDWSG